MKILRAVASLIPILPLVLEVLGSASGEPAYLYAAPMPDFGAAREPTIAGSLSSVTRVILLPSAVWPSRWFLRVTVQVTYRTIITLMSVSNGSTARLAFGISR
jgi:hypothetical protein